MYDLVFRRHCDFLACLDQSFAVRYQASLYNYVMCRCVVHVFLMVLLLQVACVMYVMGAWVEAAQIVLVQHEQMCTILGLRSRQTCTIGVPSRD